jgi:hypothetical protein
VTTRAGALLTVLLLAAAGRAAPGEVRVRLGLRLADARVADLDGDGAADVVAVGEDGAVRVFPGRRGTGLADKPAGGFTLADPRRCLLDLVAPAGGKGPLWLAVLSPAGLFLHDPAPGGGFAAEGRRVALRLRFDVRLGAPRFARLFRDLDGDGRPDLVVPGLDRAEVFRNRTTGEDGLPVLARAAVVPLSPDHERRTAGFALTDRYEESVKIPFPRFADANGDGRLDLLVTRGDRYETFLQKPDGSFPEAPDSVLDLSIFVDTTPEAELRPGRVLAGTSDARVESADLDGDGRQDHVVSHRRKLWVFFGGPEGADFANPAAVLKVAEDVSAMLLVRLDDDPLPDLLLLRLEVPSVAAFVAGLFTSLTVEISASGYRNQGGRTFEKTPGLRGRARIEIPEMLGILRDPEKLFTRFEEAVSRFRPVVEGDFDGDGRPDVALVAVDGSRLDVWSGAPAGAGPAPDPLGLREVFFSGGDETWPLDRILDWLAGLGDRRTTARTGGRSPDTTLPLPDPERFPRLAEMAADVDADGRTEVLLFLSDGDDALIEVLRASK